MMNNVTLCSSYFRKEHKIGESKAHEDAIPTALQLLPDYSFILSLVRNIYLI